MKTAISLPDNLFKLAERFARRYNISRSRLFASAVSAYIENTERNDVARRLNAVYGNDPSDSIIPEAVKRLQSASIRGERW